MIGIAQEGYASGMPDDVRDATSLGLPKAPPLPPRVDTSQRVRNPEDLLVPSQNRSAITALVLGISSVAVALVPLIAILLNWAAAPLAIIFGIIGIRRAKKLSGRGNLAACWGLALGAASIPIALMALFLAQR